MVAQKIVEEANNNQHQQQQQGGEDSAPAGIPMITSVKMRLLMPNNVMGAIIGKGGSTIQHIQSLAQCRLVASETLLPHSTDREILVQGTPKCIELAIQEVVKILHGQQLAASFSATSPNSHHHHNGQHSHVPYVPGATGPMSGGGGGRQKSVALDNGFTLVGGRNNSYSSQHQQHHHQQQQQPQQTKEVYIPNDMVGAVIGKAGVKIKEIRAKSNTMVRIADANGEADERLVTITGTADGIRIATHLLFRRLDYERKKLAGAQEGGHDGHDGEAGGLAHEEQQPPMDDQVAVV